MPDIISLMHRSAIYPHLFDEVIVGNFRLSIRAGCGWASYPRIDGLHPYQYDSFEVAIYPYIPHVFFEYIEADGNIMSEVDARDLQCIYNALRCFEEKKRKNFDGNDYPGRDRKAIQEK